MPVTTSTRMTDSLEAVSDLLYIAVGPMQRVATSAKFTEDGFDTHLGTLAKMRDDLAWMLEQNKAATATLEAARAAAASPEAREAKDALVAEARQARVVSSGPPDSDFRSSAAA